MQVELVVQRLRTYIHTYSLATHMYSTPTVLCHVLPSCRLTVTDGQGLSSSRSAYITVQPAKDDTPTADSGKSLYTVRLPQSEVTLYANKSKDDHGIAKYEWVHVNPDEDNPINIEVHARAVGRAALHLGLK